MEINHYFNLVYLNLIDLLNYLNLIFYPKYFKF